MIIKTILPDLLRDIPLVVTQSIRNFGKTVVPLFQSTLSLVVPMKVLNMKLESMRFLCLEKERRRKKEKKKNKPLNILSKWSLLVVKAFAQIIKRSTSLNHLSQAARAVWQNDLQVSQMREDWLLIDFKTVHEQAVFACGCDENLLSVGKLSSSRTQREQLC